MKKTKSEFICQECENQFSKWSGKCYSCNSWNSLIKKEICQVKKATGQGGGKAPLGLEDIHISSGPDRILTGINELDRVLGAGVAQGAITLIAGEPGVGKSTLLIEISKSQNFNSILYISGEETQGQVASRFKRMNVSNSRVKIAHECSWENIKSHIGKQRPSLVVIDSIQTVTSDELSALPGSVSQIKGVTFELVNYLKQHQTPCFIIGHITKDGTIAGPKVLEHMVDTVICFENDSSGIYRIIRATKNRFGPVDETGVFEMMESGLKEISNPAEVFIDKNNSSVSGKVLSSIIAGSQSMLVEIQALVVANQSSQAKINCLGLDIGRIHTVLAVIAKHCPVNIEFHDLYLNVIGGMKIKGTESDLAVFMAIISSFLSKPLPPKSAFVGEISLDGAIRYVPKLEKRIRDLEALGFEKIYISNSARIKMKLENNSKIEGLETCVNAFELLKN